MSRRHIFLRTRMPRGTFFQGLNGMGTIKMDHPVELLRQVNFVVVAPSFRVRSVDDTNGALKAGLMQFFSISF